MKKTIRRLLVLVLALLCVALLCIGLGLPQRMEPMVSPEIPVERPAPVGSKGASDADTFQRLAARAAALPPLPSSLAGTLVDGTLQEDEAGVLLITVHIRRGFQYFLSLAGEEDFETVRVRIAGWIADSDLSLAAQHEAWSLFERFVQAERAVAALALHDGSLESMREAVQARAALRASWLGPAAADAFYGDDDAYDQYTLARMGINADTRLTEAERQQALAALQSTLPASLRASLDAQEAPVRSLAAERLWREEGVPEAQVYARRVEAFGDAAADRLAALDAVQAAWEQRYGVYRAALETLEHASLSAEDHAVAVEHLRAAHFSETERRRVEVLDRLARSH